MALHAATIMQIRPSFFVVTFEIQLIIAHRSLMRRGIVPIPLAGDHHHRIERINTLSAVSLISIDCIIQKLSSQRIELPK